MEAFNKWRSTREKQYGMPVFHEKTHVIRVNPPAHCYWFCAGLGGIALFFIYKLYHHLQYDDQLSSIL